MYRLGHTQFSPFFLIVFLIVNINHLVFLIELYLHSVVGFDVIASAVVFNLNDERIRGRVDLICLGDKVYERVAGLLIVVFVSPLDVAGVML
jgi:hypothetical protein